jgi:hypothetical protein
MKIKSPLIFIHKENLVEFDIKPLNGFYVLTSPGFKQNLKKSDYLKVLAHQVKTEPELPFPEQPARGKRR